MDYTVLCNQYKQYCTSNDYMNDIIRFSFFIVSFLPFTMLFSTWIVAKFIWLPYCKKLNDEVNELNNNGDKYVDKYPINNDDDDDEYETLISDDTLNQMIHNIIKETTPNGNVIMRYNNKLEAFEWWSDNKNISYDFLQTITRKYVIQYNCIPLYIDRKHIIEQLSNNEETNIDDDSMNDDSMNDDNMNDDSVNDGVDGNTKDVDETMQFTYSNYLFNNKLYVPLTFIDDTFKNDAHITYPDGAKIIKNGYSYVHKINDKINTIKHFYNIDDLHNEYNDFKDNYPIINDEKYFSETFIFNNKNNKMFIDNQPKKDVKKNRDTSNINIDTNKYIYKGNLNKYKSDISDENRVNNNNDIEPKKKISFADFKKLNIED